MSIFVATVRLLRPLNLLQGAAAVLVTAALMPAWPPTLQVLKTVAVLLAFTGAANSLNDWFDFPIDRINRPHRPLSSGAVPRSAALALALVLFALGALIAWRLPQQARFIALAVALPLLVVYTPWLKRLPLVGNMAIALILGLAFLFAGAAFGHLGMMWVPFGLAAGFNLVRELVKDVQDVKGDQLDGARTIPAIFGVNRAIILARFLTLALMIGVLIPYILEVYGAYYLATVIAAVELPLLYSFAYLKKHPDPEGAAWIAKVLKVDIFFGLLAVYLSKFDV